MEQRKHPRVQLPLLVELKHPALPRNRHIARDISEGGVFVHMDPPASIRLGAKMHLTLLDPISVDNQPSPTVEMRVVHVEKDGLGMAFVNKTSQHLWQSVERLRQELAIGRDYFQVHQSALLLSASNEVLIVQQNGRWGFPGHYLIVGENWREALETCINDQLGLETIEIQRMFSGDASATTEMPEAAVYRVFILVATQSTAVELKKDSTYSNHRWISRRRDLDDVTFGSDHLRQLAFDVLDWLGQ